MNKYPQNPKKLYCQLCNKELRPNEFGQSAHQMWCGNGKIYKKERNEKIKLREEKIKEARLSNT